MTVDYKAIYKATAVTEHQVNHLLELGWTPPPDPEPDPFPPPTIKAWIEGETVNPFDLCVEFHEWLVRFTGRPGWTPPPPGCVCRSHYSRTGEHVYDCPLHERNQ